MLVTGTFLKNAKIKNIHGIISCTYHEGDRK